jgi:hypothetical protein
MDRWDTNASPLPAAVGGWPRATAIFGYLLIENQSFLLPIPLLFATAVGGQAEPGDEM